MPKIPTYLAELAYRPTEGDMSTAAAPGRALAAFGETVGKVGEQIADQVKKDQLAKQERQKQLTEQAKKAVEANDRAFAGLSSLDDLHKSIQEFESDTDPENISKRYWDRVGQIQVTLSDRISDPAARDQEVANFQAYANVQGTLLQGRAVHALSERGVRELNEHLGRYVDLGAEAGHPVELDDLVSAAEREIAAKVEAGFISAEEGERLEQNFYGNLAHRQAEKAIADDPDDALSRLQHGEDFASLAEDARKQLIEKAGRAAFDRALSRETESIAQQRDTRTGVASYIADLRDGTPPDDTRFTRDGLIELFGEQEGDERWTAIEDAKRFGATMTEARWATPDQIAARRSAFESDSAQSLAAAVFVQALTRRDEQLRAKPADYVLANPHVAALHQTMRGAQEQSAAPSAAMPAAMTDALQAAGVGAPQSAPDAAQSRRAATQAYANATLAEQERLGLPEEQRRLLPDTEAGNLAAKLAAVDPAAADRLLRDLAADWGADWPAVRKELVTHGLPGEYRLLADIENPVARQTFVKVLATQAADPGALRAKAGADAGAVDEMIHAALEPFGITSGSNGLTHAMGVGSGTTRSAATQQSQTGVGQPAAPPRAYRGDSYPHRNAVDLHDSDGIPVMSEDAHGKPQQVQIPEGVDLRVFATIGEDDRNLPGEIRGETIFKRLENFVQGGMWDLQRPRLQKDSQGKVINYSEFVNAATVAIGIYCAAAGLTRFESLMMQRQYAKRNSNFGDAERHWFYGPLPIRNVQNTNLGYDLYSAGKIPGPAE